MRRDDLDAVVIALPTFLHHRMVVAALEAGKHVLCEKPPALNAGETSAMADAAARRGLVLCLWPAAARHAAAAAAQAIHRQGRLGEDLSCTRGVHPCLGRAQGLVAAGFAIRPGPAAAR